MTFVAVLDGIKISNADTQAQRTRKIRHNFALTSDFVFFDISAGCRHSNCVRKQWFRRDRNLLCVWMTNDHVYVCLDKANNDLIYFALMCFCSRSPL